MKLSGRILTLENVYYVSQLVGVAAIVISVLYLARQVESGNDLNRTNTYRNIFQGLSSFSNEVFGPGNADLMVKGYRDFGSLSPAEMMTFDLSMTNFFNYIEDSYDSVHVGLLAETNLDGWGWWLRNRVFPYEGAHEWWSRGKDLFPEDFRSWVDQQSASASSEDAYGINRSR